MSDPPTAGEPCWGKVSTTWDGYYDEEAGEGDEWRVYICDGHANWPDGPYIPQPTGPTAGQSGRDGDS